MSEPITALPAVASNFYMFCKKCDTDRYHKVLSHSSATAAKVECEVCHSKKTFTLPKAGKPAKEKKAPVSKVNADGTPKAPGVGRGAAAKAQAQARALTKHVEQYESSIKSLEKHPILDYKMTQKFAANQKINHPKFGVGVVLTVFPQKVEILFRDEVRGLVHNRA